MPLEGGNNEYSLRLDDPSPQVVYFTDRPRRMTGAIPLAEFLDEWSQRSGGFGSDPPNAALTVDAHDEHRY